MVRMCTLLIGAGNFTTTDLIANAILALIQHPAQLSKLRANPALIDDAIAEALRYDAPSLVARRFVLEDITVAGQAGPAGSVVNLVLASANHDPSVFSQPDTFDFSLKTRKPHLSFGQGMHHCLGAPLARLEVQIAVAKFFETFPQPVLIDLSRTKTLGFRGCKRLLVEVR